MTDLNPERPVQPPVNAIPPQSDSRQENQHPPTGVPGSEFSPPQAPKKETEHCRPDQTPWWKTVIEVAAVLTAIWYAIVASKQLGVMSGQLTEMQEARKQAKLDNFNAISAQQKIAQDSLAKSQESFDKSFRSAENTFRDEQRAWVGAITVANLVVKAGEPTSASVVVINSGKTPALHLKFITGGQGSLSGQKIAFSYGRPKIPIQSDFVLQPGAQYFMTIGDPSDEHATQLQVNGITSGTHLYWLYGKVTYADVSKRTHHTKFCFLVSRDLKGANPCDTYNEAD